MEKTITTMFVKKAFSFLVFLFCFSLYSFAQSSMYIKPTCANNNAETQHEIAIEKSKKINYEYAQIIQVDPSFKDLLDRAAIINCELKDLTAQNMRTTDNPLTKELSLVKEQIKAIRADFKN